MHLQLLIGIYIYIHIYMYIWYEKIKSFISVSEIEQIKKNKPNRTNGKKNDA